MSHDLEHKPAPIAKTYHSGDTEVRVLNIKDRNTILFGVDTANQHVTILINADEAREFVKTVIQAASYADSTNT